MKEAGIAGAVGPATGYVLRFSTGLVVYLSGDTGITQDMEIIRKEKGSVDKVDVWGKRRLAYEIGKSREGIYIQMNYKGGGPMVSVMERSMRLSEEVIRYLTVKQDVEVPEEE